MSEGEGGSLGAFRRYFRDPFFRTAFFLRQDGVVHRFVDRALKGRRAGDSEAAFEFTFSDLQQVTYLPAGDASRLARDAQVEIQNQIGARAAAELLTENLGPAIQTVFGLEGAVSLTDVMMETRAVLAERGVELVLLIEDFTMLQGIQRELLDAVVEPPVPQRTSEPLRDPGDSRGHNRLLGLVGRHGSDSGRIRQPRLRPKPSHSGWGESAG